MEKKISCTYYSEDGLEEKVVAESALVLVSVQNKSQTMHNRCRCACNTSLKELSCPSAKLSTTP